MRFRQVFGVMALAALLLSLRLRRGHAAAERS